VLDMRIYQQFDPVVREKFEKLGLTETG